MLSLAAWQVLAPLHLFPSLNLRCHSKPGTPQSANAFVYSAVVFLNFTGGVRVTYVNSEVLST